MRWMRLVVLGACAAYGAIGPLACAPARVQSAATVEGSLVAMAAAPVIEMPSVPDAPEDAFGAAMLDASRALLAAAQGQPIEPQWGCADRAHDLRATEPAVVARAKEAGPVLDPLMIGLDGIAMTSPMAAEPKPPQDENTPVLDLPPSERWLLLTGEIAVLRDGRVRWVGVRSSVETSKPADLEGAPIKLLPGELGAVLGDMLARLGSPACAPPMLTKAEAATFAEADIARKNAVEAIARDRRRVPQACEDVVSALGPWEARVRKLNVIARGEKGLVHVKADLRVEGTKMCLGPADAQMLE